MRQAVHIYSHRVVYRAEEVFLYPVEAVILRLYLIHLFTKRKYNAQIAVPCREGNILVHFCQRICCIEAKLRTYHCGYKYHACLWQLALFHIVPCRIYGNTCDRHEYYGRKCNGYTVKHLTSVTVKRGYESILCLCVYYESNITERNRSDRSCPDRFKLFKAMRRKSDYDKRKHKRVAVGKPVGHLSAVPYHIDRSDIHTYNKQAYKRTCRDFLLEFKCSRAEKSCRKHKG